MKIITSGGTGTVAVDSGLPRVGDIYGVAEDGDLWWYRYKGRGASSPQDEWDGQVPIGNGWGTMRQVVGCGDGVLLAVDSDSNLRWYQYDGSGNEDRTGRIGWSSRSGTVIGEGWDFLHLTAHARAGRERDAKLILFAVDHDGFLHWYRYNGTGMPGGPPWSDWDKQSQNIIGNGWDSFSHVVAVGSTIFALTPDGDLRWYQYNGNGTSDKTGSTGWAKNSGTVIARGWGGTRLLAADLGLADKPNGFTESINTIYRAGPSGQLHWHAYRGAGESKSVDGFGWHEKSGQVIGTGW